MPILLIETATDTCSVAICHNGQIMAEATEQQVLSHTSMLTRQIEMCCHEAGVLLTSIDGVGVSHGPGSYTSLRVGVATAKGICYALDKPLAAVSTLQALAWASRQLQPGAWHLPMIDARRSEVWTAVYDDQLNEVVAAQPLILEGNALDIFLSENVAEYTDKTFLMSGSGISKHLTEFDQKITVKTDIIYCNASYLCGLIEKKFEERHFENIAYYSPHYMKPPNITQSTRKETY